MSAKCPNVTASKLCKLHEPHILAKASINEYRAIKTYNGQGVAASGVIKSHHTMIYTGTKPEPQPNELPRRYSSGQIETGMQPQAIRIIQYDRATGLDKMARLDYCARHELEYGMPNLRLFGTVHRDSLAALYTQWNLVWVQVYGAISGPPVSAMAIPSSSAIPAALIGIASNTTTPKATPPEPAPSSITDTQMISMIEKYQDYARQRKLTVPPMPSSHAIHEYAQYSQLRKRFLNSIRKGWEVEEGSSSESDSESA